MGLARGRRYPCAGSVYLSTETDEALRQASERYGLAAGVILHEAAERGLSAALERYRSRSRSRERTEKRRAAQ